MSDNTKRGRLLILTGDGKGKSSSAFGMAFRAAGWDKRVCVVQFIKGKRKTGEEQAAQRFPNMTWHVMGKGFTWESVDLEQDRQAARAAWSFSQETIRAAAHDLVILDEILYAIQLGWVEEAEIADFLRAETPPKMHIILTGRGEPPQLLALADTVTRMTPLKHAFDSGLPAAVGIEF